MMKIFRIVLIAAASLICGCAVAPSPRSRTEAEIRLSYDNDKPHGEVVLRLVR
jgi:hypothetical protein